MPDDPPLSSARPDEAAPPPWPPWRRFLFRFTFCYFLLYTMPAVWRYSVIGLVPGTDGMAQFWSQTTRKFLAWVAAQYFGIYYMSDIMPLMPIEIWTLAVLALLAALIWSLLDRKRTNYATLHAWFRLWLRYTLAFTLFVYGFAKVLPVQMTFSNMSLVERWGDFSPFGALWAFMAASKPYQIFSGAMEVIPGILLLFRRTTLLGAAISLVVMTNVTALDYCYDIPPKIYATHLALISIFLLLPDASRLANVLILNRPTPSADLSRPVFPRSWMRVAGRILWVLAVAAVINKDIRQDWRRYKKAYIDPQSAVFHGLYSVETFKRNGQSVPPLITDDSRWHWANFFAEGVNEVSMTEERHWYDLHIDTNKSSLTLTAGSNVWKFKYARASMNKDTNYLDLHGTNGTNTFEVRLHKTDLSQFPLLQNSSR